MKKSYFKDLFILIVSIFIIAGCGGGNSGGEFVDGNGNTTQDNSYELDNKTNHAIMGPLEGATVNVYTLNDINKSIETTKTGKLGSFSLKLKGIDDNELLLVAISGGKDVDANDDGILDKVPTVNKGTIHGFATAKDLREGKVNVTLLSEIVYQYSKHLIGKVHPEDLKNALNYLSISFLKYKNNMNSYKDIISFIPIKKQLKDKLSFNYSYLIGNKSYSEDIYNDENSSNIKLKLNSIFGNILSFNSYNMLKNNNYFKIKLIPGFNANVTSKNCSIFIDNDNNKSKLEDFVKKDSNISFTLKLDDNVIIKGWNGCDDIIDNGLTCKIININSNRQIIPLITYKKSILNDNVKDITNYHIYINDNNYTVSLDLDANSSQKDFIENIQPGDVIISNKVKENFSRKVISKIKVDEHNYIFQTNKVSIFDIFTQAGINFNRYLTHDDLVNERSINRSLKTKGMQLLPPRFKGDDLFVIAPINENNKKRSEISGTWKIWENEDKTQSVSIQGKIAFKIKPIININTHFLSVKSVKLAYEIVNDGEAKLIVTGGFNAEKKISLLDLIQGRIVTGKNVDDDGWEPKGLDFDIVLPYFKATVSVPIFVGVEGSVNSKLSLGLGWTTIETVGMDYSNGQTTLIQSSTRNFHFIGEIPGENIEATVGAFIEPRPSIIFYNLIGLGANVKVGPYITLGSGIEYNNGLKAGASLKLDAKVGLVPQIKSGSLMPSALRVSINKFNNKYLNNTSLEWCKTIYEKSRSTSDKPSFLEVSLVPINETYYADENYIKDYIFQIRNTGNEVLNWKLNHSGFLPTLFDFSDLSGQIEAGESKQVTISVAFDDLPLFAGETLRGKLEFENKDNPKNYIDENIQVTIKTKLPKPIEPINAYIVGTSLKKIAIYGYKSYNWPDYIQDSFNSGFNFYISDYNTTTRSCDLSTTNFITSIGYESQEYENDYFTVDFKDLKEIHNIKGGKKYCIMYNAYYGNDKSPDNNSFVLYIPKYGSIKTSIKDINGTPIDAKIYLTSLDNSTIADSDGNVIFNNLLPGRYLITVDAEGFINTPSIVTVREGEETQFEGIRVINKNLEGLNGVISGQVINALNSSVISNAVIEVRAGNDNISGNIITSTTTDNSGHYNLTLPTGNYTLKVSKDGYINLMLNVLSVGNETITQDLSLSPILNDGEMRIVLRWGENPSDLDSHLVKKTNSVENYHIYYSNKVSGNDKLDRDDIDSYGPETITIHNVDLNSVYTYYVYDYSHNNNSELKNSSATVDISYGNFHIRRSVPNENGYYWKVFEIVNGEIKLCNTDCVKDDSSNLIRDLNKNISDNKDKYLFSNLPKK